jgi:hypothetical protein
MLARRTLILGGGVLAVVGGGTVYATSGTDWTCNGFVPVT